MTAATQALKGASGTVSSYGAVEHLPLLPGTVNLPLLLLYPACYTLATVLTQQKIRDGYGYVRTS